MLEPKVWPQIVSFPTTKVVYIFSLHLSIVSTIYAYCASELAHGPHYIVGQFWTDHITLNFTIFELIIEEHFIHLCNIFWTPILAIQSFLGASTSWPPLSFLPSNETGSHTTKKNSGWKFTNKLKNVMETVIWMWPIWKHGLEKEARWIEEPPANSQPHHGRQHTHHHLHNINIIIIIFIIIIIATS